MKLHQDFTGGNIELLRIEGSHIYLGNQLRDTAGDWFYWAFCVEGAEGMTLTFHFDPIRLGYFGPAVSHDLKEWHWLGSCDNAHTTFTYTFGEMETKVYFAHSMLYHPDRFLALLQKHSLKGQELCKSGKGRSVPCVTIGDGKTHIILAARHHACESTGNYVLEGVLEELIRHPIPDTTVFCVPFVDYDGVVDGDQGKGRTPHDHNRDYDRERASIYPTTAAIRAYAEQNGCLLGFDFHSPWHWGEQNDQVFIVQNSFERLHRLNAFGALLEKEVATTDGAYPYYHKNDFPYKKDWNQGGPTFAHFINTLPDSHLAFTLETAYFGTPATDGASAVPVSATSLIALGTAFSRAIAHYLAEEAQG